MTDTAPTDDAERDRIADIERWLRYLTVPGQVVELRAPDVGPPDGYRRTFTGYFDTDHLHAMADAASVLTGQAPGVYYTINALDPELLHICNNNVQERPRHTARDEHVFRRILLPVDIDPTRFSRTSGRPIPGDLSSTAEEKTRARELANAARADLARRGWPDPALVDSGNGYYLLYRVDLPADDGGLVGRCLRPLAQRHDTRHARVDTKVFNPGRILKVPGTWARKGEDTPDRPHRRSRLVEAPDALEAVPVRLLEELAGPASESPPGRRRRPQRTRSAVPDGAGRSAEKRARA